MKEVIEEKDLDIDDSLGDISFSDDSNFKSAKKSRGKMASLVNKVNKISDKYENLEDLRLENELFRVISFEIMNKEESKLKIVILNPS